MAVCLKCPRRVRWLHIIHKHLLSLTVGYYTTLNTLTGQHYNYNKHWGTAATVKPNEMAFFLSSKCPLQKSGLLCEHKGPLGRTVWMTHWVTSESYQPGSATKPAFRSPTQAVAALTPLWNCTGRTQEGKSRLVSHSFFFSEQIGLFIYLPSYFPRPASEKKFGFLMRCDSTRASSHAHTHRALFQAF